MDRIPSYTPPPPTRSRSLALGTIGILIISLGLCPFIATGGVGAMRLDLSARLGTLGLLLVLGALTALRARWNGAASRPPLRWMRLVGGLFWVLLALMGLWLLLLLQGMDRPSMGF